MKKSFLGSSFVAVVFALSAGGCSSEADSGGKDCEEDPVLPLAGYCSEYYEADNDGDGTVDFLAVLTYSYDANGNRLGYDLDEGGDDLVDRSYAYTYDANGNRLTEEHRTGDGTLTRGVTNVYGTTGNLLKMELDSEGDGVVDQRITYDAHGNMLVDEWDRDNDGVVERRFTYTNVYSYDEDGHVLVVERYDSAINPGTPGRRFTRTYDAVGNLLIDESDNNADGVVDRRLTYTYDQRGNVLTDVKDLDADGNVDARYTYTYDAQDNRITWDEDTDGDGAVDRQHTATYDAEGNPLAFDGDYDGDGAVDWREIYIYDAQGRVLTAEEQNFSGGVMDYRQFVTYGYDC